MENTPLRAVRAAFVLAVSAGIFIGIGGTVLLSCENRYVGAVLFSVALLSICMMGLYLYTGKVGFLAVSRTRAELLSAGAGLLGNAAGAWFAAWAIRLARPSLVEAASAMVAGKLTQSWYQTLLTGIFCGILMYAAVLIYREKSSSLGILLCVPVFILAGFEHSIADMFYFFTAGAYSLQSVLFLLLVVLGNTAGALLIPALRIASGDSK